MAPFSDRLRSLFEKIDGYQQILELWVPGKPMPKGSMTAFARRKADGTIGVNMMNYSNSVGEWQSLVSYIARQSYFEPPVTTAVRLHCAFTFVRPQNQILRSGKIAKGSTLYPVSSRSGDLDKLTRCICDALTGIVYVDDCQIFEASVGKYYGLQTGAMVRVFEAV